MKSIIEDIEYAGTPITVWGIIRAFEEGFENYHDICMKFYSSNGYSKHVVIIKDGNKGNSNSSHHNKTNDKKRLSRNSDNFNQKKKISKPTSNPTDTDKACNHCGFSNHAMDKCVFGPGGAKPHPDANPSTAIS